MTKEFKNKHRSTSSRLQSWDYGWSGAYFITICTQHKKHFFGEITDGNMQLTQIGILADTLMYESKNHAKNIKLENYIVMPNHVHAILIIGDTPNSRDKACLVSTTDLQQSIGQQRFQNQGGNTISSIIGSYKSAVAKHAHRLGYDFSWQSRFHDHIIRNDESFNQINEYITTNPENWKTDKFYSKQVRRTTVETRHALSLRPNINR